MSRRIRFCPPWAAQHVIQRGTNRQACFLVEADYAAYAYWLNKAAIKYEVQIHAWVFMTNHTHLLVTPAHADSTSRMMQQLGSCYVAHFNKSHQRTGTLWEGRFRSCLVESEEYLLRCYRYIESNPVRAQMAIDPGDYKWSSYRCNGYGIRSNLCTPHQEYLALGANGVERMKNYRALFLDDLSQETITEIRISVNTGLALNNEISNRAAQGRP